MHHSYEYIDSDSTYTYPGTNVLRNLADITDPSDLLFFESVAVIKRAKELEIHPVKIKNAASLLEIHRYLFQDVYQWAGQKRTIEISKQGKPFIMTKYFEKSFSYINTLIANYREIDSSEKPQLARQLAILLDNINFLHPFREGNGRAQREFIRLLALEKGYSLNLNPPDNLDVYERYMSGSIEGDVEKFTALIMELMQQI
ncbi:MAG: Fic family protein [Spirochaetes bacterium]|nr:Fic family protein [Spirochaetota bacterium]